jgi:sugar/nucleoside kinase (ribokinase family)
MSPSATIGHLSRDVVAGGAPRIGGGPWYAGRALRPFGLPARLGAKCGAAERETFACRLASLGLPTTVVAAGETTAFSFSYDSDGRRSMRVDAVGDPWQPGEALAAAGDARWVHVAPLLGTDFPEETLAALARGRRRILLDGQGLVRVPAVGPLELDPGFDPALLRHVSVLKLAEDEASALELELDEAGLASLGVPEVVVTLGGRGSLVLAGGKLTRVPARAVDAVADPTGAGDAFAAAYVAARSGGHAPAGAAQRATALVAAMLGETVR